MQQEYVLSFSSFYKAAYAQDILAQRGIQATLKKLPTELVRSCNTGIYLRAESLAEVRTILDGKQIQPGAGYRIQREGRGKKTCIKVI